MSVGSQDRREIHIVMVQMEMVGFYDFASLSYFKTFSKVSITTKTSIWKAKAKGQPLLDSTQAFFNYF